MIKKLFTYVIKLFLLLLPFQTIWVYNDIFLNGVKSQWGVSGWYVTEVLLWVIVVLFIVWRCRHQKFKIQNQHQGVSIPLKFKITRDRVFLLFVLLSTFYFLFSTLWAPQFDIALQQSIRITGAIILFIILMIGPWKFQDLVPWFVGGAVVTSVIGIGQFFMQSSFSSVLFGMSMYVPDVTGVSVVASDTIGRWLRAYGTFVHPNVFGGYMTVALVLWTLYVGDVMHKKLEKVTSYKLQVTHFLVLFILLLGLLLSFSRSALLAYCLLLTAYCFYIHYRKSYTQKWLVSFSAVFLIIMGVILWPLLSVRFGVTSSYEVRSVVERAQGIHSAWDIAQDQLWFGGGIGNYVFTLFEYDHELRGWQYEPVHNIFFLVLVEIGVVGLVLIVLSFSALLWWLYGQMGTQKYVWFFVFCGVLVYGVIGLFDHYVVSLYSGLMLSGVWWGMIFLYIRDLLHR